MNRAVFPIVFLLGFFALGLLYMAGAGYKGGSFELGQAFKIMEYCAYAGITATGLVIFYMIWQRPVGITLFALFLSALSGLTAFYLPYRQQQIAQRVPPIHDITTDTSNPPQFVAILPLRADAPNPPDYLGGQTTALQRSFYPDIMTHVYVQSPQEVFAAASEVVADFGWELIDANAVDGRIEATASTRWFGFKDDVVVRLRSGSANSTILDVRSKSRIGLSDVGVNANRIRAFTAALNNKLMID